MEEREGPRSRDAAPFAALSGPSRPSKQSEDRRTGRAGGPGARSCPGARGFLARILAPDAGWVLAAAGANPVARSHGPVGAAPPAWGRGRDPFGRHAPLAQLTTGPGRPAPAITAGGSRLPPNHASVSQPPQPRTKRHGPIGSAGGLFKLAVLAAPAVEPERRRAAIPRRLALDAGPNAGQNTAPSLWDFVAACFAMGFALARWHAGTRSEHPVDDGVVDLILHRPVRSPSAGHCRFPVAVSS